MDRGWLRKLALGLAFSCRTGWLSPIR